MSLAGHLRTVTAWLGRAARPPAEAPWREWTTTIADPRLGPIALTGRWTDGGGEALLVVVHGLGGSATSGYAVAMAAAAARRGWSVLRLNLRGADRRGEDFYHAALTADLHGTLADPALAGFGRIGIVGFSLGGHVALAWATEDGDPRVRRVAAICPPLDLAGAADHIDRPAGRPYRAYVLRQLKEIYRAVARRRPVPLAPAAADRIRTLRAWDEATVAPRHGFSGAADYYARASVGPRLGALRLPALLVAARGDPMVPLATLEPYLGDSDRLVARRVGGGHVAFPRRLDLGAGADAGLEAQTLAWLGS